MDAARDGEISQQGGHLVGDEISDGDVGARNLQAAEKMNFESCQRAPFVERTTTFMLHLKGKINLAVRNI